MLEPQQIQELQLSNSDAFSTEVFFRTPCRLAVVFMALSLPLAAKSGVMLTNWRTAQRWEEWKTADEENQWIRSHVPTLMVSPFHHMEALQIVRDLRLIILEALGFMLLRPG